MKTGYRANEFAKQRTLLEEQVLLSELVRSDTRFLLFSSPLPTTSHQFGLKSQIHLALPLALAFMPGRAGEMKTCLISGRCS